MGILDLFFPKRCVNCNKFGDYLCSDCFSYLSFDNRSFCLVCKKQCLNGLTHKLCKGKYTIDGCFSALKYNLIARKLIYSFKNKPYLSNLDVLLSELFYESLIQNEGFMRELKKAKWVFVPIPLSNTTFRKRGYNQAEILAKNLSQMFKIRTLDINKIDKTVINVFLIDDVVKTGKTLQKASDDLKRKGVKRVLGLILASS